MHIFYPTAQESWNHNLSNVAMMTQFPASGVANERVFITEIQKNVLVPFRNFYLPMVLVITAVVALTNFNTPLTRSTDVELRGGGAVKGVQGRHHSIDHEWVSVVSDEKYGCFTWTFTLLASLSTFTSNLCSFSWFLETARLFMRGLLNRPPSRTAVCAIYSRILLYISPLVFIHGFPRLLP